MTLGEFTVKVRRRGKLDWIATIYRGNEVERMGYGVGITKKGALKSAEKELKRYLDNGETYVYDRETKRLVR